MSRSDFTQIYRRSSWKPWSFRNSRRSDRALEVRNIESQLNQLKDSFSRKQLLQHFHLYQQHVIRLYELEAALKEADRTTTSRIWGEFSELRRRHAVAFNGAVLHELYFEN